MNASFRARVLIAATAALVIACGKSENNNGGTGPNPSISLGVSKSTLTAPQGGSDNLTATITRAGGFTGAITIVTEGTPAGVDAAASNITNSGSTTTGTVTVTVGTNVPVGSYNLTVRASGTGVTAVTQSVTLVVTPRPTVSIALGATAQSVDQGASGTAITVTITRVGFTGALTLAVEGAPAGVTGGFTPQGTTGNTSSLVLSVGGAVPAQTYNLMIRATGTGVTDATAPLALTVTVPGSFTLAATPVTTLQGTSAPSTISITRVNFPAGVTLTLEGAPAGVTGVFAPTPAPGATSTLTLTVGQAVPAAQYTLTVRGASAPLADRTTTFTLTVTAVTGSFTLTTTPTTSIPVPQGGGGVGLLININRTGGFTGTVTPVVTGAPAGLTATVTPAGGTGVSVALTLVAGAALAPGNYPLVITGSSPGLANQVANLTAVVNVPNQTLSFASCLASAPIWLSYQDGPAAPWIQLLGVNGVFKVRMDQTRVGFTEVLAGFGSNRIVIVRYQTAAELQGMDSASLCFDVNPGPKSITVSETGVAPFDVAFVTLGGSTGTLNTLQTSRVLTGVSNGLLDLVAHTINQNGQMNANSKIIIRRDLNLPDGGAVLPALDFGVASAEAVAPLPATITVTGFVGGEILNSGGTSYRTGASCDQAGLFSTFVNAAVTQFTGFGVPVAKQRSSDLNGISVTSQGQGVSSFRTVTEWFLGAFTDRSIALPSVQPAPTITFLAGAHLRPRFQWIAPPDLASSVFINSTDGIFEFLATGGWLGGTTVDLAMPDFSTTANFDLSWIRTPSQTTFNWFLSSSGASLPNSCAPGRVVGSSLSGTNP